MQQKAASNIAIQFDTRIVSPPYYISEIRRFSKSCG
jgi:hypothetical protein